MTIKPGLPVGPFQQKIRLRTNVSEKPEIELQVFGAVENDLQILGRTWDQIRGILTLGTVDPETGGSVEVKVSVRGPERDRVKLAVKEKVPQFLEVEFGEPEILAGGVRLQFPVTIKVPPGDAPDQLPWRSERKLRRSRTRNRISGSTRIAIEG